MLEDVFLSYVFTVLFQTGSVTEPADSSFGWTGCLGALLPTTRVTNTGCQRSQLRSSCVCRDAHTCNQRTPLGQGSPSGWDEFGLAGLAPGAFPEPSHAHGSGKEKAAIELLLMK